MGAWSPVVAPVRCCRPGMLWISTTCMNLQGDSLLVSLSHPAIRATEAERGFRNVSEAHRLERGEACLRWTRLVAEPISTRQASMFLAETMGTWYSLGTPAGYTLNWD